MEKEIRAFTVGEINSYISRMFLQDYLLSAVAVRGEIGSVRYQNSGHIYFTLKDETGILSCVMFAGQRRGLAFHMETGDKVVVRGKISTYERDGKYQLYANRITREGAGELYERFLALKQELEDMGMFSPEYKKPIPRHVRRLGVVTSPTGAVIRDIQRTVFARDPFIQIILFPANVQGIGAKESIVRGIQTLDAAGVDAIIVGRGGGSLEELWAFNEECVARAIFECETPVISAVGHETDFTISDFVADARASTPLHAADLAAMDVRATLDSLELYRTRFNSLMNAHLKLYRQKVGGYESQLRLLSPGNRLRERKALLMQLEERIDRGMASQIEDKRRLLSIYIERMKGLSPLSKLNQGFSYVEKDGKAVTTLKQVQPGDELTVHVTDGQMSVKTLSLAPVDREGGTYAG